MKKGLLYLDWAEIIDYICILEVKAKKNPTPANTDKRNKNIDFAKFQLDNSGVNIWEILGSNEYQQLYDANKSIFEVIDQIRDGDRIDASIPDNLNIDRYKAKQKIQNKFFGSELAEFKTKIG